jgi:molybdopterin/thiamine biosynthesis adenylyltransferase
MIRQESKMNANTKDLLAKGWTQKRFPDGTPYKSLSLESMDSIASSSEQPPSPAIVQQILQNGVIPERYARNMQILSTQDQSHLLSASVCVVGLGGLGGQVVEILSRIGVGHLHLVDGDVFEESNLNRQLLSQQKYLGSLKAEVARQRVLDINDGVDVTSHAVFLTAENATSLISDSQVVVDCLDNLATRFILENGCRQAKIPLVSAAIAGLSGQLTVIFPEDPGLAQIYGSPESAPEKGAEATLGTLPNTAAVMAALEATEVIKVLLGRGMILRNRLLVVDLLDHIFEVMQL